MRPTSSCMVLHVYNTLSRTKEEFVPFHPPKVGFYSCGPTVYNYAHIGNLRSYVFADILKRVLKSDGFHVTHVMNITDVGHLTSDADEGEDKMEKGAKREGKTVWQIAQFFTDAFRRDIGLLNISDPNIWCKATDHIKEQIAQIQKLEKKGFTYITEDGVYFDTSKLEDYGKLAKLNIEELEGGARIELGEKKSKTDFALWKYSPKDGTKRQMEWWFDGPHAGEVVKSLANAPGYEGSVGFPGWHIECSAMSTKYLGEQFDLHTGGIDHIPVHHTNEIAQAECALGKKPWVKYWMHGEFLVIEKGKMAKSGENFLTLQVLLDKGYPALAYRYFCLTAHYRQQLAFSFEALDSARASYERLKNIMAELVGKAPHDAPGDEEEEIGKEYENEFREAANDDLNMPQALSVLWNVLRDEKLSATSKVALATEFDSVLGLDLLKQEEIAIPDEITRLAEARIAARKAKDWGESDRIRDEIKARGFIIDDKKDGTYGIKKA